MTITNVYLITTMICYIIYFTIHLPRRMKFLDKWKKHHYDDEKENDCSVVESEKCIQSGELIEHYMKNSIRYIGLRFLCLFNKDILPMVFLDNLSNVANHMLRMKKWGFHYFLIYHFVCFLIDIFLILKSSDYE